MLSSYTWADIAVEFIRMIRYVWTCLTNILYTESEEYLSTFFVITAWRLEMFCKSRRRPFSSFLFEPVDTCPNLFLSLALRARSRSQLHLRHLRLVVNHLELVERVCSAARDIDEDLTVEAQVDAQKKILRQQARSCIRWTNNRLEGLREDIQENLKDVVKEPIEAACKRARDRRKHRGKGATTKILDAFETGGAAAIGEASKDAKRLLRKHYKSLLKELEAGYLKEHHDPVTAAVEALIGEEHDRAKEADDEARKAVLRRAKSIARDLSELTPEKGVAA